MLLVKIGGGKHIRTDYIAEDIALLLSRGERIVVVHGANAARDELAAKLHTPTRTITSPSGISSVYTDSRAIDIFLMAYAGLVNKRIVAQLQNYGVNAVGLSGIDGRLWEAKRKAAVYVMEQGKTKLLTDNLTGKVTKVNVALLELLMGNGYTPVICPPAISSDQQVVNTDNDHAIAVMVEALGVRRIVSLFEAPGMLRDMKDMRSVIPTIPRAEFGEYLSHAEGRMKKKILGAQKAFELGLKAMYFGDGRMRHPVLSTLDGKGTIIS